MGAGLLEDADDARRALVPGLLQVHGARQVRIGGDPADRYGAGVRGVAEQCAQDHHHLHAQLMGEAQELVAERAPAHRRLDTADQDEIAGFVPADADHGEPGGRPGDLAYPAVQPHRRPVDLEVVVVLGVERREHLALPLPVQVRDRCGSGVTCVVPSLERGHHDRVDQLGNPLELDHPGLLPKFPCVRTNLTASGLSRRSPCARPGEPGPTRCITGPTRASVSEYIRAVSRGFRLNSGRWGCRTAIHRMTGTEVRCYSPGGAHESDRHGLRGPRHPLSDLGATGRLGRHEPRSRLLRRLRRPAHRYLARLGGGRNRHRGPWLLLHHRTRQRGHGSRHRCDAPVRDRAPGPRTAADLGALYRELTHDSQLRWLGPEKG